MALVDSESAFKKRCEQLQGLGGEGRGASRISQNQVSDAEIAKLADTICGTPTLEDWQSKKLICSRPRKRDCCSDVFCQNWRSFIEPQCFCKSNRMVGPRGTRLLIEGLWLCLHVTHLCQSTMANQNQQARAEATEDTTFFF